MASEVKKIDHVILGYGEIGKVIYDSILSPSRAPLDKGQWECLDNVKAKTLHICIPYTKIFVDTISKARKVFKPEIMVIHSTVEPGTTELFEDTIYSPVMGRHDDEFNINVRLYTKYAAGDIELFKEYIRYTEIPTEYWGENTKELEFAKCMSTSYMYWNLIYQKIIKNVCDEESLDFKKVYGKWNQNYNEGISVHHPEWVRPIYEHNENPIPGGHCIVPNIYLHDNFINNVLKAWTKNEGKMRVLFFKD